MTQTAIDDGYEVFDKAATDDDPIFKPESAVPDALWVGRIQSHAIGSSFRVVRQDTETVRQLKKRINRAAMAPPNFKTLEWKSEETNVDSDAVKRFRVRVKAIDIKAQQQHEAKARQNGTTETAQTTIPNQDSAENPNPEAASTGPRRPR